MEGAPNTITFIIDAPPCVCYCVMFIAVPTAIPSVDSGVPSGSLAVVMGFSRRLCSVGHDPP